jgi:hypothetical protein
MGLLYVLSLLKMKNGENPNKTVENAELRLTKTCEKPKVNGGTVLRTRVNIGVFDPTACGFAPSSAAQVASLCT